MSCKLLAIYKPKSSEVRVNRANWITRVFLKFKVSSCSCALLCTHTISYLDVFNIPGKGFNFDISRCYQYCHPSSRPISIYICPPSLSQWLILDKILSLVELIESISDTGWHDNEENDWSEFLMIYNVTITPAPGPQFHGLSCVVSTYCEILRLLPFQDDCQIVSCD